MKPPRILIVEDETIIALDLKTMLLRAGYEVAGIAGSGEEAVRMAGDALPDLVLMDIVLSGAMDGIEAAREIRKRFDIPLIYLSANADQPTVARARDTGPYGYINKPIHNQDLFSNVDTALYKHEMGKKLRESEEKYRHLVEEIDDVVYEVDAKGIFTFISPVIETIGGYTPEEVVGRAFADFVYGEDLAALASRFNELKSENPGPFEFRALTKSGAVRWIRSSNRPVVIKGEFMGVRGIFSDVTGRRSVEEALRRSEEMFFKAFHHSPVGMVIGSLEDGVCIDINDEFLRLIGYSRDEVVGRRLTELDLWVRPEKRNGVIREVIEKKLVKDVQLEMRHSSGEVRTILWSGETAVIGKTPCVLASMRDITGWSRTGDDQGECRRTLSTLMENLPGMAYRCRYDRKYTMEFVSEGCRELTGYTSAELLSGTGPSFGELIHPGDRNEVWEKVRESISGSEHFQLEYRIRTRDGNTRWVWEKGQGVFREDGELLAIEGFITDITEHRLAGDLLRIHHDLVLALGAAGGIEEALGLIMDAAFSIDGIDSGGVYFADGETGAFDLVYHRGLSEEFIASVSRVGPGSARALMVMKGRPMYTRYSDIAEETDRPTDMTLRAMGIIPIHLRGKIIGTVNVSSRTLDDIPAPVQKALETMFMQIGGVVERIRTGERLKQSLREKEVYLREIHHRVKNNFQIVSSLLNHEKRMVSDAGTLALIDDIQSRIHAMGLVHQKLYQSKDFTGIDFGAYMREIVKEIYASHRGNAAGVVVQMNMSVVQLNIEQAIPCGLLVNELITNALKYAFPADAAKSARLSLALRETEDGTVELTISDNGVGIPESIQPGSTATLGLALVPMLARQLNGAIILDRSEGTMFTLSFRKK